MEKLFYQPNNAAMKKRTKIYGLQAADRHVGFIAVPADNSYTHEQPITFNISEGIMPDTSAWGTVQLAGKQVKIESAPWKLKFKMQAHNAQPKVREFVTVRFENKLYSVLNSFRKIGRISDEDKYKKIKKSQKSKLFPDKTPPLTNLG